MKKLILIIISIFLILTITACDNSEKEVEPYIPPVEVEPDYEGEALRIRTLIEEITIDDILYNSFDLVPKIEDYQLTWTSTVQTSLSIESDQAIVKRSIANVSVVLEVTTEVDEELVYKKYNIVVAQNDMPSIENYANDHNYIITYLNSKLKFDTGYQLLQEASASGSIKYLFKDYDIVQNVVSNKIKYDSDSFFYVVDSQTANVPDSFAEDFFHETLYVSGHFSYYTTKDKDELLNNEVPKYFSRPNYYGTYGKLPIDDEFTSYVISDDTVLSSSYNGSIDGVHEFVYNLSTDDLSGIELRYRKYGTLESVTMQSIKLTVFIDENWELVSFDLEETYHGVLGTLLGKVYETTFTQKSTTVFNRYTEGELLHYFPQVEKYKNHLASL